MRIRLDTPLSLAEIADATGGTLNIESQRISYIVTDTREAERGDLFFALQGETRSGEQFIEDAKEIGAHTVGEHGDIVTKDATRALLALASYYKTKLRNLKYTVAITGSVGKTTTKEILGTILSSKYKVHKTHGNFNNILGVSYTLLSAANDCELLVLELGMNHSDELAELSLAVKPDIAIITNIGTAHIGNLGTRDAIAKAKLEIKSGLKGSLIIPDSEPLLSRENAYRFSITSKNADMCILITETSQCHKAHPIYSRGTYQKSVLKTDAEHIALAVSASLLAARLCNCQLEREYSFFVKNSKNSRQSLINVGIFDVLCDFYNASLESFLSGFKYALSLDYNYKSALIGDILELGEHSREIHFSLGKIAAELGFRSLYLFGEYSPYVKEGAISAEFPENRIYINTDILAPHITAAQILSTVTENELLYAKASHKLDLARIIELLKEKR